MQITRVSILSGKVHTKEIPVTERQLYCWEVLGMHIQEAMPNVSKEDREFLISGSTPEEWDEAFGEEAE